MVRTLFHPHSDGSLTVQRIDDVEPILERNKVLQNTPQTRTESFHHIATIPNIVIEQWLIESGLKMGSPEFTIFMRKKLRDRDWLFLRSTDKRL